jgi:hypothetical protein
LERHSVNDATLHFGLGLEKVADIEIRRPNGLHEKLKAVAADRLIILKEGIGIVPNVSYLSSLEPCDMLGLSVVA